MSKTWSPVIDYENCIGCLSCVEFCPHEVFEEKDGKPSVKNPENCVEFCRGCARGACPNGAISFAGDRKRTREVV